MSIRFFFFSMILILVSSCSDGLEEKTARKWKVVSFDITPGADVSSQDRMMIEGSRTMFKDVVYELDDNGEFRLVVSGNLRSKGKYEINKKDSTILFGIQGMKEKYKIVQITDTNMVLQSTIKPVEMRFKAQ